MNTPLRRIASTLLCFLFLPSAHAAGDHFIVTALAPDLLMLGTDQGSYCTNSLIFTGTDGVLLVDTHHASESEALESFLENRGFGPPTYIITTHRHVEHIGGNGVFGADPIIVAHTLVPEKLRSGAFQFMEYPPESMPDITFNDSMEIHFNGELIRLTAIGGSHDDNEILVHFTKHGVAHVSSVVNGFNFPSVDDDGDALGFEAVTRRLMNLLPRDIRVVSGHNGKARGFDFVGTWDMLTEYADMMKQSVEIVRVGLNEGKTLEQMQGDGVLDEYRDYAGSYVSTDDWLESVVSALTEPRDDRADVYRPVFEEWKKHGARAAVDRYRTLLQTQGARYNVSENVLLSIGSKLYDRGLYDDSIAFLRGSIEIYPEAEYGYYTHYLAAKAFQRQSNPDLAARHCRESLRLNPEFTAASRLLAELAAEIPAPPPSVYDGVHP
jgi:glyoxylase-like metal-dependent hydrolase (beta-lactamase superfamily II)